MAQPSHRIAQACQIKERAKAADPAGQTQCTVWGCTRATQRSTRRGLSATLCKLHGEHLRRHGHASRRSYSRTELEPYRKAAEQWLREHRDDPRVSHVIARLDSLMAAQGRPVGADRHRWLKPLDKARNVLSRLRQANKTGRQLLHIVLTTHAAHSELGPFGSPPWLPVQIAKQAKRLRGASGTIQRNHEGVPLRLLYPYADAVWQRSFERWPRGEGRYMALLGQMIADRASSLTDHETIQEVLAPRHAPKFTQARDRA